MNWREKEKSARELRNDCVEVQVDMSATNRVRFWEPITFFPLFRNPGLGAPGVHGGYDARAMTCSKRYPSACMRAATIIIVLHHGTDPGYYLKLEFGVVRGGYLWKLGCGVGAERELGAEWRRVERRRRIGRYRRR